MTFPFRWKAHRVENPSSRWAPRVNRLSLICNACEAVVIAGTPYNHVGQRYFTYYANIAALEHFATHAQQKDTEVQP